MLWLVFTGDISLGEFFSLLFYSFLIFNPLYELPKVAKHLQEARASSETLEEIFALQKEKHTEKGKNIESISSLSFDNVSFGYTDELAVKNIHRDLQP